MILYDVRHDKLSYTANIGDIVWYTGFIAPRYNDRHTINLMMKHLNMFQFYTIEGITNLDDGTHFKLKEYEYIFPAFSFRKNYYDVLTEYYKFK